MTWSYGNDPINSELDEVRLLIGDTDTSNQLITNEAITYALDRSSDNTFRAAAFCCRLIAANFAREVDNQIDSVSVKASDKQKKYLNMASVLEDQAKKSGASAYGVPWVGGIDVDEIESAKEDTSRQPSKFYTDQFTNNGSSLFDQE